MSRNTDCIKNQHHWQTPGWRALLHIWLGRKCHEQSVILLQLERKSSFLGWTDGKYKQMVKWSSSLQLSESNQEEDQQTINQDTSWTVWEVWKTGNVEIGVCRQKYTQVMEKQTRFYHWNMLQCQFVKLFKREQPADSSMADHLRKEMLPSKSRYWDIQHSQKYTHWNRGKGRSRRETLRWCEQVHKKRTQKKSNV